MQCFLNLVRVVHRGAGTSWVPGAPSPLTVPVPGGDQLGRPALHGTGQGANWPGAAHGLTHVGIWTSGVTDSTCAPDTLSRRRPSQVGQPTMLAAGPSMTETPPGDRPRRRAGFGAWRRIPLQELTWRFSTSGGPGGQHVNTSNTRAEVHFRRGRLAQPARWARTGSSSGWAHRHGRRQRPSVADPQPGPGGRAPGRPACRAPWKNAPNRRPTRPTRASQRRRVEGKRRRGDLKQQRRRGGGGSVREDE